MAHRLMPRLNRRFLRACRVERGWSVPQAARIIGISPQALYYLEASVKQPRAGTLQRIAEVYGVMAEDFYKAAKAATTR